MKQLSILTVSCLLAFTSFSQPFITTWQTINSTDTIPGTGTNYTIAWVEVGNPSNNGTTTGTNTTTITFPHDGIYQLSISGGSPAFSRINFGEFRLLESQYPYSPTPPQLLSIDQWGSIKWSSLDSAFFGCSSLALNATDIPDLSAVADMSYMFGKYFEVYQSNSYNNSISNWNTSSVTNMSGMFENDTVFNQPIGNWNTGNVTDMSGMFEGTVFNQPIGNWNTGNVTDMSGMFEETFFNQPIGNWNTSNVTDMSGMFSASTFNQPIGNWNTSNVIDMSDMFGGSAFNQPIENWNVSNVTNMHGIFGYSAFNQPIDNWNTKNVTKMNGMFNGSEFNQPIGNWNTANVTSMENMFFGDSAFNQPIGTWNTVNVTNMSWMFYADTAFNQPIGNWNTSNVTDMAVMFWKDKSFNQPIGNWNTENVTDMDWMFNDAVAFNQPIGNWNTGNVTTMLGMFDDAIAFNQPIGNWNTGKVTIMLGMFEDAIAFNQPIGNWNTGNVGNMGSMFSYATAFNQNLGKWNITSVGSMFVMLDGSGLSVANYDSTLIGWDTQPVQNVDLTARGLKYCNSQAQRNDLITNKGWSINDDSLALGCPIIVPVTFVSFNATLQQNKVLLQWQTAIEVNNAYFIVQRSKDGNNWQDVTKVAGAGNSSVKLNYAATVNNPYAGISYYRLKQFNKDGGYSLSQVRTINIALNNSMVSVYPNPVNDIINVSVGIQGQMQLFDALGKQVTNSILLPGNNEINIQSLSKGIYIMSIETSEGITRQKVLKN